MALKIKTRMRATIFHYTNTKHLKGHCHGNFAMFWSKPLKYLTKSLFFNMKLLIQHWEENTKVFLSEEQTIVIFW